jgi:hypothetical protein
MDFNYNPTGRGWLVIRSDQVKPGEFARNDEIDLATKLICATLLEIDGNQVAILEAEMGSSLFFLNRGKLLSVPGIVQKRRRRNYCHHNCVDMWMAKPHLYRLVTGWALNQDVWRRHSWLLDNQDRVVENTVPRERYFGVILTEQQARLFNDVP